MLREAESVLEQAEPAAEESMEALDAGRRLLLVHAHPDDETIGNGATMARYAAEGAHVTLVTCTLGEEGEVLVPELAHLAADQDDELGQHRVGELATAMEALGVRDHRFLGGAGPVPRLRDDGAAHQRPARLLLAGRPRRGGRAAGRGDPRGAAPGPRDLRRDGGYGHPDHIQAHRVAMRAVELAGRPGARHRRAMAGREGLLERGPRVLCCARASARLREAGDTTFFEGMDPDTDEMPASCSPDELVTTQIDGMDHVDAKMAAMRAHATQITVDGPFFALSNNLGNRVWGIEYYRLVQGQPGTERDADGRETDLFAGLD